MPYEFNQEEIKKISQLYPDLKFEKDKDIQTWEGVLKFDRVYKGYRIIDSYECKIIIFPDYPSVIPWVHEIGNRTEEIAKKWKISNLIDLHCNSNLYKSACLCVKQEEKIKFPPGSSFIDFIEKLAIPYFYGLSYFNENGKWPWKEYSHGALGILEYHSTDAVEATEEKIFDIVSALRADNKWRKNRKILQKLRNDCLCMCGSNKLFKECHPNAFNGLLKLKSDMVNLRLNTYKLFQMSGEKLRQIKKQ